MAAKLAATGSNATSSRIVRRASKELDPRSVWKMMNSLRGDVLYGGEFDDVY